MGRACSHRWGCSRARASRHKRRPGRAGCWLAACCQGRLCVHARVIEKTRHRVPISSEQPSLILYLMKPLNNNVASTSELPPTHHRGRALVMLHFVLAASPVVLAASPVASGQSMDIKCIAKHCMGAMARAARDPAFLKSSICEMGCNKVYINDTTPEKLAYQNCTTIVCLSSSHSVSAEGLWEPGHPTPRA